MPGIVLKDNSANYRETALGWAGCPVDATALEMAFFFGGTLDRSLKNYAAGKSDAVATGTPTTNVNSLVLSESAYLTTAMADSTNITLVVAFRQLTEATSMVVSNYAGGAPTELRGTSIFFATDALENGLGTLTGVHASPSSNGTVANAASAINTPICAALRFDSPSSTLWLENKTAAVLTSVVVPGAHVPGGNFRLGRGVLGGFSGQVEVYAAMGFSRKLSDDELTRVYQYLKAYAARRSVTI